MTLVTSGGWIPEANERRSVRDEVRIRFQERVGVKPFSSISELSLSPSAQALIVKELIGRANPQKHTDIATSLRALSSALGRVGLGTDGVMANDVNISLDVDQLVPQQLLIWHFLGEDADE